MFYGVNGHFDYTPTIAQQIADIKAAGFTCYRVAYEGPASLNYLENLANAVKGTGITLIVCIDGGWMDQNGNPYATEQIAFANAYAYAAPVVQALAPLGVQYFECGNEMETKGNIQTYGSGQCGGVAVDFQTSCFPALRGTMLGMYTAIKMLGGPGAVALSNAFTKCDMACSDMLWDGLQPDGTSGYNKVRWDGTNWHNYEDYGNPFDGTMSMDYQKPALNLCDHLQAKYGVPIYFTEWNGKESDTDAQRCTWAQNFMGLAYWLRQQLNIKTICVYQLYDGSPWGIYTSAGHIKSNFGTTVKTFIANNPAT